MSRFGMKGILILAMLGMLLALPFLAACGGQSSANRVTIGWLADQTGPSAGAFAEVMMAFEDYMAEMKDVNDVDVQFITYDTRLDPSRYALGYEWLKNRGVSMILHYQFEQARVLASKQASDKIPSFAFAQDESVIKHDWVYGFTATYVDEGYAVLKHIISEWEEDRPVKVGLVGAMQLESSTLFPQGFEKAMDENPGRAEYKVVLGGVSQTAWASEINSLKDCDVIFMMTVGAASASFIKEANQRGFEGRLYASTTSVLGFWTLITDHVGKPGLDGLTVIHFYPLWTDDNAYVRSMDAVLQKYRPDQAASLKVGTTWQSGYIFCDMIMGVVKYAADSVGPENIDGTAMRDALRNYRFEREGLPALGLTDSALGLHVYQPYFRIVSYDAARDNLYPDSDWQVGLFAR